MNFLTRNYKHEIHLHDSPRCILNYTDAVWEALCGQIAAHGFNGLVLYPDYHPFESILDYKGFAGAATQPASRRRAIRLALCRGLAIAHRHGLKTFMQHYVGHFSSALARKYRIRTRDRNADVEHPQVDRYARYCYREIFRQLPDLDGLYFNFESSPSAFRHVLDTAIPEMNRRSTRPIAVFRLWDFTSVDGMKQILRAYKGRAILAHKIPDTNDTYYLPVADSRVAQWKRELGNVEWMFLVGPCHNCATNICSRLWADYDFVQSILADARAKGADSISFHTVNEFFSPGLDVFDEPEKQLARFNFPHLQAAVDFMHGTRKSSAQRRAALAARVGCPSAAAVPLLRAIESSSKIVPLVYQQFCYGSSAEGYLNRGHFSHIFDPYFYYPATELNHQARRPQWNVARSDFPWLVKDIDSLVAPENSLQYIIDYVEPEKTKSSFNPARLAAALGQNVDRSLKSLAQYHRLAGPALAGALEPHIRANAAAGDFARHEILAAIQGCAAYFAPSRRALQSRLRQSLSELKKARSSVPPNDASVFRSVKRAFMFNRGPDLSHEIQTLSRTLGHIAKTDFPFDAFAAYITSRRLYNDIRRSIRPARKYDLAAIQKAGRQMKSAHAAAAAALVMLQNDRHGKLAAHIQSWLTFLETQHAWITPPAAPCPGAPSGNFHPLIHHHCFRRGESFTDDFLSFFQPVPAQPDSSLAFALWHTKNHLTVRLRESGVSAADRIALWKKNAPDPASLSFTTRLFIDPQNTGDSCQTYVLWPQGAGVSLDRRPDVNVSTQFTGDAAHWQITASIPYALIGHRPRPRQTWGFNITANPSIQPHREFTWAAQYDAVNPGLFGKMRFVD